MGLIDSRSPDSLQPAAQAASPPSLPPSPPPLPPHRPSNVKPLVYPSPRQLTMAQKFAALERPPKAQQDVKPMFSPGHFFFYGSLMDPEVLQTVLDLPDSPTVQEARIIGFRVKMWGIYPTLVPDSDKSEVMGTTCKIEDYDHFLRLVQYETLTYTCRRCTIYLNDGSELKESCTFCWAKDPESLELSEGSFDLVHYQRYFKPSVVRRRRDS